MRWLFPPRAEDYFDFELDDYELARREYFAKVELLVVIAVSFLLVITLYFIR
ncbi:hypothetical protein [Sutterella sp.]|uniref:hypothetical protein n=1 Tax=Sutterella sp. TaxID=1981025 RepID=UPI0026DEE99A|nr:hypothetical protein [Sutterella sp.]MDO5532578.1 hypothetical protein [Sutterella sp.]